MRPSDDDVQKMVQALFTLIAGINRATRRSPDASRLAVLQVAAARPAIRPSEIATELGVNQSSITRHVQVLEHEGQVTVMPDPQDLRANVITLTESGKAKLAELVRVGINRFSTFVAEWDAEDLRTLTRLLVKLEESKAKVARREVPPTGHRRSRASMERGIRKQ
jgi:DNA-binding MarR family transcriptional regulator